MIVELIPVIEIGYNNQGVDAPTKYPYWENSELWDKFHEESYLKAGFKDKFVPYLKGSSFYKLTDISDNNLLKLVADHTEELRAGKYGVEDSCAFFGGYVLVIDGQDKYLPQCCGELSDIAYWDKLSKGQYSYYEGHPAPQIFFDKDIVTLDFTVGENDETFVPLPPEIKLKIDKSALSKAVEKVKIELSIFAERLKKINTDFSLGLIDIDKLLIWHNENHGNISE